MSNQLALYMDKKVMVITQDGRFLLGTLLGTDQATNLILSQAKERIISPDEVTIENSLGAGYIVRGECVALVGLVDESLEKEIDWSKVRGKVITEAKNPPI